MKVIGVSRYSKYGRVAKCGSPDSKYMSRPNGLDEDIQNKTNEANKFESDLRELFINSPGRLEFKYEKAIEVFLGIKKEFNL